jgi:hypothetical protein
MTGECETVSVRLLLELLLELELLELETSEVLAVNNPFSRLEDVPGHTRQVREARARRSTGGRGGLLAETHI